jgi:regulator of replication initiation timing
MAKEKTFEQINKSIADVSIQINKLLTEYKKLQAEGKSSAEINERLGKSFETLNKKLATATNAARRYSKQESTTQEQRKQVVSELGKASAAYQKLAGSVNAARVAEEKAAVSNTKISGSLSSIAGSFGKAVVSVTKYFLAYRALNAVLTSVESIFIGSAKAAIEYEDSLGNLAAVTGATGTQLNTLSEAIRNSAKNTRFTSGEIAELSITLGKLGATADEIPSLLSPIALAAQATGASLADVGETIFKVNNQFGLSSSEAAATAQTLVSAVNSSALSLESFGTAIQYVGPIANQIGLSFNETSSYLELLADNGFKASRIGTGLRKIFIDLKKPGEDIAITLQNLADKNISVAEANELVGKTASAQLLTILRNIDALQENSSAADRFADSLQASAARISTTAGTIDILKSAVDDLKISFGNAIINSELFTEAIGFLFPKVEELTRGYKALQGVFSTREGTDTAKQALGELADSAIAAGDNYFDSASLFKASQKIFAETGQGKEFLGLVSQLQKAGLTYFQSIAAIEIATTDGQGALVDYLGELGKLGQTTFKVGEAFRNTGKDLDELGDQYIAFKGFTEIVQEQGQAVLKARKVEKERLDTLKEYADEIERIQGLGPTTEAAGVEADKLTLDITKKRKDAQEELNLETQKGILADQDRVIELQGQISAYDNLISTLSEFGLVDEEQSKKAKKAYEDRAKAQIDDLKKRKAAIAEEIKLIKQQRDQDIQILKDRAKLQGEAAGSLEERAAIELKLNQDIADLNVKTNERLEYQFGRFVELSDDASEIVKKYGKDLPDVVEGLSESINDLNADFFQLSNSIKESLSDTSNDAIDDVKSVMATYRKEVDLLDGKFGENAGKTEEYFTALESLTTRLGTEVLGIADKLDRSTTEGEAAYQIIVQLLSKIESAAARPAKSSKFDWKSFWQETLVDGLSQASDAAIDALNSFNDVALENTKDRLQAELEAIRNSSDIENDILRSKLDSQLITEAEYRAQVEKNRKKEITQQNAIEKQIFMAEQKRDRQQALSDYLVALASIVPSLIAKDKEANPIALAIKAAITAGIASVSYGAELRAINQRKFYPTKFAEGGLVNGPSHEQGGVPFTVRGQQGYEMEGGEYIVNKRATQKYKTVLDQINSYGKSNYKFAEGGIVKDPVMVANRQIELLEAIASSNVSLVGKLDKPVRAFVASDDLRSDSNALRIKERNSQL